MSFHALSRTLMPETNLLQRSEFQERARRGRLRAEGTRGSFAGATALANSHIKFGIGPGGTPIRGNKAIIDFISISQALVVADQSSFSRAARILGVKQSAVSRRIQALEDELGVSLFERQSNGVRLTIAGQRFLERTRAAFTEIDYAITNAAAAGRGDEGVIRIGVLPSLLPSFLCDLLAEFREAQPKVRLDFFEGPPEQLIARIMARRLDIVFIASGAPAPGCDAEVLWSAGICVALSERHPLAGCDAIDWELLKDEHFVMGREATAVGFRRSRERNDRKNWRPPVACDA